MEGHPGHNFPERSVSRKGGPKEYRISKADIGGPLMKEFNASPDKMEKVMLRCVTIQKDEKGFGLTVSGDNPVYVQSVKENGSAMSAGVLQGDRIYKVNGINVIESNHVEVVKLIKAENHVTLTLFSPNKNSEESGGAMQELPPLPVTRPHSSLMHDEKVSTIKKMLNQEKDEVERIKEEYARNPDKKLLENLRNAQKLLQDLEKQLWKAESSWPEKFTPINHVSGSAGGDEGEVMNLEERGYEKPKDSVKVQQPILNFEDEELAEESQPNHGPFLDFNILKTKPAHAAVFLNFVFHSHLDPSHLLLMLMTDIHRQTNTNKEMNKLSDIICKTYLSENAPLKVSLDEGIAKSIIDNAQSRNIAQSRSLSDDALRSLFDPAAQQALKTVKTQLELFCSKREQGLSNCYGEEKVSDNMTDTQVVKVVEEIVTTLLQDLAQLPSGADESEAQKSSAKVEALEKLLTHWTGKKKNKISSRLGSMLRPNRPPTQTRPWSSASVESILEEQRQKSSGKFKLPKKTKPNRDSTSASSILSSTTSIAHPPNLLENNEASTTPIHKSHDSLIVAVDSEDRSDSRSEKSIRRYGDGELDNNDNDSRTESDVSEYTSEYVLSMLYQTYPELDISPESSWSANAPPNIVKQLNKKECKRQEVINELLQTEQHHVRDLQILSLMFYQKMKDEGGLSQEELTTIFPNLHEILEIHQKLKKRLNDLKKRDGFVIKEIGSVLAEMFLDISGEKFKQACATYCGNQSAALVFIKEKCKKDQKFNALIQSVEKHPICRRLQLKDLIPVEFQRLTKYPLLLENIMKNSKKNEDTQLPNVHKKSKEILQFVDKAIKDAEDIQKVVEIQKTLDSSALGKVQHPIAKEYKNINLTERTLIHQGPLSWRVTINEKKKSVGLHCVLFEDIMVLLQKQEDRYVLKCHTNASAPNQKDRVQPPILKLSKVIVRVVATDKKAFYVLSASEFGAQIYELVASTAHEMHEWMDLVSSAIEIAKKTDNVSTPMEKSAFLIPETQKSVSNQPFPKTVEESKQKITDDIPTKEDVTVGDENTFSKLQSSNLASIMNEALNPDTEFLLPTSPHLLTPVSQTLLNPNFPTAASKVPQTKTNIVKDLPNDTELQKDWDDQTAAHISKVPELLTTSQDDQSEETNIPADVAVYDDPEKSDYSNTELEIIVASDYETASESPSPSGNQVYENSENNLDDPHSNTDIVIQEEQLEDLLSSAVTEGVESGIATFSNYEKTTDGSQNDLTSDVLSPMESESLDLVDFETHVLVPEESNMTSSMPDEGKTNLFMKTNPINVTKMLKIQRSMHSQLLRLLEILKSEETTQEPIFEKSRKSPSDNNADTTRQTSTAENEVLDGQELSTEDPILIISEDVSVSPTIPKK